MVRSHTTNLSRQGLFVQASQPLPPGTKVALSLEAGGKALPFAEAQVVWAPAEERPATKASGFGVRFERFLHPRGRELVEYLVDNLDRGRPLASAPRARRWRRPLVLAASLLGAAGAAAFGGIVVLQAKIAADNTRVAQPVAEEGGAPAVKAVESVAVVASEALGPAADARQAEPTLGPPAPGETRGEIVVPTGAASALTWAAANREVRLSVVPRDGRLRRAFLLADPPRVVFDLDGSEPDRSYGLEPKGPFLKRVRVGSQKGATRVVVDLTRGPTDSTEDGEAVILSF